MYRVSIFLIVLLLSLPIGASFAQDSAKEKAALKAARAWLVLIDEGKYAKSWGEAATYFRNNVTREQWEHSLKGVRKPLGSVISRNVLQSMHTTYLPGAPDGEYVVIQFKSSFENKKTAIETVTPMLDRDGSWRVSGYYIK
jgi:hypothetical protein